jgi:superfamily II DNA/RNA helicase
MANVTNNATWDLSDVIVSTPMTLAHILKRKSQIAPFDINPSTVVLDEVDLLLGADEVNKKVVEVLKVFATKRGTFAP